MPDWFVGFLLGALVAGPIVRFARFVLLDVYGRHSPEMHRLKINAMRRRVGTELDIFEEKHGAHVDDWDPDDDPIDHPDQESYR